MCRKHQAENIKRNLKAKARRRKKKKQSNEISVIIMKAEKKYENKKNENNEEMKSNVNERNEIMASAMAKKIIERNKAKIMKENRNEIIIEMA